MMVLCWPQPHFNDYQATLTACNKYKKIEKDGLLGGYIAIFGAKNRIIGLL
jgi:hypothetical protein